MARFTAANAGQRDADRAARQHDSIDQTQYVGTKGDDHIRGGKFDDTIEGRAGDDVLGGRYGYDHLFGGGGDDVLRGGTERQETGVGGGDRLDGGAGDDRLYGGFGGDALIGGPGKDLFVYTELSDSTVDLPDEIADFEQGKDKLVLRKAFHEGAELHFIGDAPFSHTPGEVRYVADADSSAVQIDLNGDGMTDTRILFATGIHFQASDFSF